MKSRWIVVAVFALAGLVAADPALARAKHKARPQCIDRTADFSMRDWLFSVRPYPKWNGCSPPVYGVDGEFIGQDPDRNIRASLRRHSEEGYRVRP